MLIKAIGASVGLYPNDIADMLVRNKVIAPAPNYTTNQLVEGVVDGLNKNADFQNAIYLATLYGINKLFNVWIDNTAIFYNPFR